MKISNRLRQAAAVAPTKVTFDKVPKTLVGKLVYTLGKLKKFQGQQARVNFKKRADGTYVAEFIPEKGKTFSLVLDEITGGGGPTKIKLVGGIDTAIIERTASSQRYKVNLRPKPCAPGQPWPISEVEVIAEAGVIVHGPEGQLLSGSVESVLPRSLQRALGPVLKAAGKTLGPSLKKFKTPKKIREEDITYDEQSSVDEEDKPEPQYRHPKVRAIRRTFDPSEPPPEKENPSFPQSLPSEHPKEVAIRKVFEESKPSELGKREGRMKVSEMIREATLKRQAVEVD